MTLLAKPTWPPSQTRGHFRAITQAMVRLQQSNAVLHGPGRPGTDPQVSAAPSLGETVKRSRTSKGRCYSACNCNSSSAALSPRLRTSKERTMSARTILVIILIIFLLGGFSGRFGGPGYGYGHRGNGLDRHSLIIVVVLLLTHRI